MIHPIGAWSDRVQGSEGILRHFDAVGDLGTLRLINLHYDSAQRLEAEFISFTAPTRYAPKWSKDLDGGTILRLIGYTNRLNIIEPAFCCETSIEASDCKMTGIAFSGGKSNEVEFQGVAWRLRQNDVVVVDAKCFTLRLGGIEPVAGAQADQYRHPERYA